MEIHFAPQSLFVLADEGMVDQVVLNLAVNARDAMPSGGQLTIATSPADLDTATAARMPAARAGAFARLSVSDNGCGIAKENLAHIFEPFFTTKDIGKGTGLGLATVFGVAQQHQGWGSVQSEVGRGTTFDLYLPRLADGITPDTATPEHPSIPGGSETILVVEDEPGLRQLARKVLTRLGYKVLEAPSGLAALDLWPAHQTEVDLLLTDLVMPDGVTGRELAGRLLASKPTLRVLYTSGYSLELAGLQQSSTGDFTFLQKPYLPETLARMVRDCLDRR